MKLSDKLDDITRKFWGAWKLWRQGQGWAFGADMPNQKMSPWLVANFEQLPIEGTEWFRQYAALMLWVLDDLPLEAWGVLPKPAAVTAEDAAAPRLRDEIVRLRAENEALSRAQKENGGHLKEIEALRNLVRKVERERDDAHSKADEEHNLRRKCEGDAMMAEEKLAQVFTVIADFKRNLDPTTKAVKNALAATKSGHKARQVDFLNEALFHLTGEHPEPDASKKPDDQLPLITEDPLGAFRATPVADPAPVAKPKRKTDVAKPKRKKKATKGTWG